MNTKIKIFNHPQFGDVRCMMDEKGEPWFVGKDMAEKLGYKLTRKAIFDHVEAKDKTTVPFRSTGSNYKTHVVIINESGLYSLIMQSKLPQAKVFKHWVTAVVLPQIRKTGGYIPLTPSKEGNLTDSELFARAMIIAQNTIALNDRLQEHENSNFLDVKPNKLSTL